MLFVAGHLHAATLIVANKAEATVSLIDLASGKVAATLPVGTGPHEVAVSPDGRLALIANYGTGAQPGSTLTLIDVPGAKVVKTIDLGEYRRPHGMVFLGERSGPGHLGGEQGPSGGGRRGGQGRPAITHRAGALPHGGRDPGRLPRVRGEHPVGVHHRPRLESGEEDRRRPDRRRAEGIAVTPDGRQVWVTNREADTVAVVDASSLKIVKNPRGGRLPDPRRSDSGRQAGPGQPRQVRRPGGVFHRGPGAGERVKLEATTVADKSGRLLQFGDSSAPIGIEIAPDGKRAYVAHANADQISIVDLAEGKRVGFLAAGKEPDGMGDVSLLDRQPRTSSLKVTSMASPYE